jgi:hypothetical protein
MKALVWFAIMVWGVVVATEMTCPVLFFVVNLDDYRALSQSERTEVDYGNFLLKNGTQFPNPYYLPSTLAHDMWNRNPCAMLVSIITDDAKSMAGPIEEWILLECQRLQRKPIECYVPTQLVFTSKVVEEEKEEPPITNAPTIPSSCLKRIDQRTCESTSDCHWFGAIVGCQKQEYCGGLELREACLARKQYCRWSSRLGCTSITTRK